MSIRVIVVVLFVLGFSIYAYRNWFASLCATVFLMAFLKHPDMPRNLIGVPGVNLWNILLANVVIAWWLHRRQEGLVWDLPRSLKIAFWLYFIVIAIACARAFANPTGYYAGTRTDIIQEFFVNSIRFLVPAILFYDGCRTRKRVTLALGAVVLLYFLLAAQVIRYMGFQPDFSGSELNGRAAKIVQRSVGYNRVDMSMMLSGASWAAVAFSFLAEKRLHQWMFRGAALAILMGQALTGGRMGYVTWGVVGFILCTLKWRKLLPLIPVVVAAVVIFIPGVRDRMLSGFVMKSGPIVEHNDDNEITSGRNLMWPAVIAKIEKSPIFGYGRIAMIRTGLAQWGRDELGDEFDHPHEAYLELLLDNGIVGFLCVAPLFIIILKRSVRLFMERNDDRIYEAAGGVALSLLLGLMFAAFGAQTFYPREGVVGMWAAIGVALRVSVERGRQKSLLEDGFNEQAAAETSAFEEYDREPIESMA